MSILQSVKKPKTKSAESVSGNERGIRTKPKNESADIIALDRLRYIALLLCLVLVFALCGCSTTENSSDSQMTAEASQTSYTLAPERKVIIDTDTGADDASALILAGKSKNIDILGVTVLAGNVDLEQGTKNALAALEIAGCDAPVYRGSSKNYSGEKINAFSVFGTNGMGDADLIQPTGKAEDQDAVDFILETVKANPDEVEIIALGPATNIAKAIERDPETMKLVKRIWSMGSSGLGKGNATPVAEFNVYHDPYAYKVMLDAGIPTTVVGFDMCGGDAMWSGEQFDRLSKANEIGRFVSVSFSKLREFYQNNGYDDLVSNCDALAMMCVVYDGFVTDTVSCHGSCITEKGETHGQVIFYQQGFTYDVAVNDFDYNVTLVSGVNGADYFDLYLQAIGD